MSTRSSLLALVGWAVALSASTGAAADTLYLESMPADSLTSTREYVRHSEGEVGFVGIRFTVGDPVTITRSSANLYLSPFPQGSSDLFFMGIEALSGPTDLPDFVLDDPTSSLLAYAEAQAIADPESEAFFPMDVSLVPGSYALLVGCAEPDCWGALPYGALDAPPLLPGDDYLMSIGTTSSQTWFAQSSTTFRLALHAVPEPGTALLVTTGLVGLGLSTGRRKRWPAVRRNAHGAIEVRNRPS